MRIFHGVPGIVLGIVIGGVVAGTSVAAVTSQRGGGSTVSVCVTGKGVVRSADEAGKCPAKTKSKKISVKGPKGARGPAGPGAVSVKKTLSPSANAQTVSVGPFNVFVDCTGTDEVWLEIDHTALSGFYGTLASNGIGGGSGSIGAIGYLAPATGSWVYNTFEGEIGFDIVADVLTKGRYDVRASVVYDAPANKCFVLGTATPAVG